MTIHTVGDIPSHCVTLTKLQLWVSPWAQLKCRPVPSTENFCFKTLHLLIPFSTAARFNSKGRPKEVARVTGNRAYQAYMVDVLNHEGKRK